MQISPERWLRIKQLFDECLDLTPEERQAYLAATCPDDPALRHEVESLLDSYLRSGTFLEDPAGSPGDTAAGAWQGRRIGPYEIGQRIGVGGMGEVYRARDMRLNRTVAIKVRSERIAWRIDLHEQFAREASAISALNHPHICLLHDVGQHDSIDFLVMEYVEGEPIDLYCDRHGLSVRQRLTLFCAVCDAVHYAHQNLIIHRDLKPANILVTGDGQPKLLDFGIAKLTAPGSGGDTLHTLSPVLTPDYASPEQVRGETVTTATDVYSLGVVLYELLAGRPPFALRTTSLEDIVHNICETDAQPPSVARQQQDSPAAPESSRAARELRGDLDTIVLKALRKEPDRRYLSAQAFSDDLQRYLDGQPVAARGDALTYRVTKFVGRHRVAAAAAGLFLAGLLGAMALIVHESRIAEAHRQRAERRFGDVRRLAGSLLFELHDAIKQLPGSTRARELLTRRSLEYLDSLAEESADDPALRAELARAYQRVGDVQGGFREANLGNVAGALASYRKALALQEALLAAGSTDRVLQQDVARTLIGLGDVQIMMRDIPAAHDSFRRALAIRERLTAAGANERDMRRELGISYHRLAYVEEDLGDHHASTKNLEQAIAILEPLAADARDLEARHELARSYKTLGGVLAMLGDYHGNLGMVQKALRLNEALAAADPMSMTIRNEVAMSQLEEGRAHERLKNLDEALKSYRRAERLTAEMAAADAGNVQARWMQGLELNLIGVALRLMGRPKEAAPVHLDALTLLAGVLRADPANENYHYNVANTYQLIGDAHAAEARAAAAGSERLSAWRTARAWYRRSAEKFDAMRQRGTLTLAFVPDADAVDAALAMCARELGETVQPAVGPVNAR
jgi:non-specific serine/threonine protein kinase/serine/threonine-protein kinase